MILTTQPFEKLFANVKDKQERPSILLISKDPFDIQEALELLKEASTSLEDAVECSSVSEVKELAIGSLFGPKRVKVCFRDVDKIPIEEALSLQKALEEINSTSTIFTAGQLLPDHPIYQMVLKEGGLIVVRQPLKPWEAKAACELWLTGYLQRRGSLCTPEALNYLATEYSERRAILKQELDKLLLYTEGKKITLDDIFALTAQKAKRSLFDLHDAVLNKDKKELLEILKSLENGGVHPLQITRYIRNKLHSALLDEEKNYKRQATIAKIGKPFLMELLFAIDAAEVHLKNQSQDEALTLEKTLLKHI